MTHLEAVWNSLSMFNHCDGFEFWPSRAELTTSWPDTPHISHPATWPPRLFSTKLRTNLAEDWNYQGCTRPLHPLGRWSFETFPRSYLQTGLASFARLKASNFYPWLWHEFFHQCLRCRTLWKLKAMNQDHPEPYCKIEINSCLASSSIVCTVWIVAWKLRELRKLSCFRFSFCPGQNKCGHGQRALDHRSYQYVQKHFTNC